MGCSRHRRRSGRTAAAAVLCERGHRVLVLEREKFPRYHIGESLLPFTFYPLQRLGLVEKDAKVAVRRNYACSSCRRRGKHRNLLFFHALQRRRGPNVAGFALEFDQMLVDDARAKGATIVEGVTVTQLLRDGDRVTGVRVRHEEDATGRSIGRR